MSREAHHESVAFAQAEIDALANRLMAAEEKAEEALAAVVQAVGEEPDTESGRIAYEWTAMLRAERIPELIRFTENIKAELLRYGGGF